MNYMLPHLEALYVEQHEPPDVSHVGFPRVKRILARMTCAPEGFPSAADLTIKLLLAEWIVPFHSDESKIVKHLADPARLVTGLPPDKAAVIRRLVRGRAERLASEPEIAESS